VQVHAQVRGRIDGQIGRQRPVIGCGVAHGEGGGHQPAVAYSGEIARR
jgi:hypothetical protein